MHFKCDNKLDTVSYGNALNSSVPDTLNISFRFSRGFRNILLYTVMYKHSNTQSDNVLSVFSLSAVALRLFFFLLFHVLYAFNARNNIRTRPFSPWLLIIVTLNL